MFLCNNHIIINTYPFARCTVPKIEVYIYLNNGDEVVNMATKFSCSLKPVVKKTTLSYVRKSESGIITFKIRS